MGAGSDRIAVRQAVQSRSPPIRKERAAEKVNEDWPLSGLRPGVWDFLNKYPEAPYLACAMLALVMALIVIRTRAWYLAAMVSVMLVLSPILNGTLPMWGAMLASFSAWRPA